VISAEELSLGEFLGALAPLGAFVLLFVIVACVVSYHQGSRRARRSLDEESEEET
jgi:hypothetical protein